MLVDFLSMIKDSRGNISPQRFRKQYFLGQDKEDLWGWFEEQKTKFVNYTNREIIILLQNGYAESPKCVVCGSDAKVQTYSSVYTFDYCSKECSLKSDSRKEKLSNTKKSYSDERKTEIENKRKSTNLEKYGVEYQSQRDEVKEIVGNKSTERQLNEKAQHRLSDKNWLNEEYVNKKRSGVDIANELDTNSDTVMTYCRKYDFNIRYGYQKSVYEIELANFIQQYFEIETSNRSIIFPQELDIYIPEKKIAIEFNGLYWHSNLYKENNYHKEKHGKCKESNIRLITLYEDEWVFKKELVKKKLLHILGISNEKRVFSRKCEIVVLSKFEITDFLNQYHIQGSGNGSVHIGLKYENEVIAGMSFLVRTSGIYELSRYATKYNIIGGFSKLLSHFKNNFEWNEIVTFADLRWHYGDVYEKNGFMIDGILKPDYEYIIENRTKRSHKFNFRKKLIKKKFPDLYNPDETEHQNMNRIGIPRIYDCGKIRWKCKSIR